MWEFIAWIFIMVIISFLAWHFLQAKQFFLGIAILFLWGRIAARIRENPNGYFLCRLDFSFDPSSVADMKQAVKKYRRILNELNSVRGIRLQPEKQRLSW